EAVAAHHDRIFPYDLGSGSNLTYRDHPPDSWAPDLHVVDPAHVVSLVLRRTRDDGQKTRFLRVDSQTSAARFAVEADHAAIKTCLQGLRHLDSRDAVTAGLQFGQFRPNHLFILKPVVTHADGPAIILEDLFSLIGKLTQLGGITAAEARLNAA